MMTELFDQFMIPELCGIKLLPIAMLMPTLLAHPPHQIRTNRLTSLIMLLIKKTTKHLFSTMSMSAYTWALILITTIMFISTTNTLGLLPYTFTPTTQLSMNMAMAMPLWLATVMIGLRNQPTKSLSHFLPEGTPTLLIPALIIIETISLFIRPLALGVRLTANLTAGHLLIQLISMAAMKTNLTLFPTIMGTLILLTTLEVAVALIQAYVFTLLLSLYLQENTH
uniref:ATP synthase subunit a n=1 Tax=Chamaeleo calyptratus TaxID=179908 RepID=B7S6C0_CHACY|nr:ATP synthase F0 subunit 6 [Chamaeleo calyptratus]ABM89700.1 ATP synthase F0 subunit 6 [Chamaeleo calyptratus]